MPYPSFCYLLVKKNTLVVDKSTAHPSLSTNNAVGIRYNNDTKQRDLRKSGYESNLGNGSRFTKSQGNKGTGRCNVINSEIRNYSTFVSDQCDLIFHNCKWR